MQLREAPHGGALTRGRNNGSVPRQIKISLAVVSQIFICRLHAPRSTFVASGVLCGDVKDYLIFVYLIDKVALVEP